MSTAPQAGPEMVFRNLDVIDYLIKRCKWCNKEILDSSTKPRMFCDNNNSCCSSYSRKERNKVAKRIVKDHAAFEIVERPMLYVMGEENNIAGYEKPVQTFRRSVLSRATVRIPKFGGGLRPCGVSVATK